MKLSEITSEINDQNEQNIIKASENESAKSNLALAAALSKCRLFVVSVLILIVGKIRSFNGSPGDIFST